MMSRLGSMPGRILKQECSPCQGTGMRSVQHRWHKCSACEGTGQLTSTIFEPSVGDRVTVRSRISPFNGFSGVVVRLSSYCGSVGYIVAIDGVETMMKYCGSDLQEELIEEIQ